MSLSYNLIDEAWIPCIWPDGRREALGLYDVLARASEIKEIRDDSPLVTISLHRLLLAILHRNFGPSRLDAWGDIWSQGRFEPPVLEDYFGTWRERFNLYDPDYPFYQDATVAAETDEQDGVTWISPHLLTGNWNVLWEHSTQDNLLVLAPDAAAKYLVTTQSFSLGGFGPGRIRVKGAPCLGMMLVTCLGDNLFETLWLNACIYNQESPIPRCGSDAPPWECSEFSGSRTAPWGYVDFLTWQSRRMLLLPDQSAAEPGACSHLKMLDGNRLQPEARLMEPMALYQAPEGKGPANPQTLKEGKSAWRDAHALFGYFQNRRPPEVVRQATTAVARGHLSDGRILRLGIFGMSTTQAKILFWRQETVPLPLACLADPELLENVATAVEYAEKAFEGLRRAVWRTAVRYLFPHKDPRERLSKKEKRDTKNFVTSLQVESQYWAPLESPFRKFIFALPAAPDESLDVWEATVKRLSRRAFSQLEKDLDSSPRAFKALHRPNGGWGTLNRCLRELSAP